MVQLYTCIMEEVVIKYTEDMNDSNNTKISLVH